MSNTFKNRVFGCVVIKSVNSNHYCPVKVDE